MTFINETFVNGGVNPPGGTSGTGTVESVSVASANGYSGTVANATTTPQITLKTTVTGLLKGDAVTGIVSQSVADTDYLTPGTAVSTYVPLTQKGAANGVAPLGADTKISTSYLPAAVLGSMNYQGTWNATTNTPTLASGTGTKGYYYVVSADGTTNLDGVTDWKIGDWAVFNGTVWQKIDNTDGVASVNGYTGAVVLAKSDIGLGNVENTALSTWAGTTNITTLGTIGTGTWSATAIAATKGGTGLTTVAAGSILAANALDTISAVTSASGLKVLQNNAGTISWAATTGTGNNVFSTSPTLSTSVVLAGATSGNLTVNIPATVTTYAVTLPSAQGTGALTNDGAGNLSWTAASGLTWGTSVSGATGTGLALTMSDNYAASGIGQSITIGNTQTNALIMQDLQFGTSSANHIGTRYTLGNTSFAASARVIQILGGNKQNNGLYAVDITNFAGGRGFSITGSTSSGASAAAHYYSSSSTNANSSYVSGFQADVGGSNFQVGRTAGTSSGAGVDVYVGVASGLGITLSTGSNVNASTNGLVNYTLSNTQSGASVVQKIDTGTSAQGQVAYLAQVYNASTSARGFKADFGSAGTGIGYEVVTSKDASVTGIGAGFSLTTTGSGASTSAVKLGVLFPSHASSQGVVSQLIVTASPISSRTTDANVFEVSRNQSGAFTATDNYNVAYIKRTNITSNAGATMTAAGSVLKAENVATQTAGTLTDTVDVINLTQSSSATTGKLLTGVVGATERFKVHPMVANSGTNNAYLFDTTTALSGTTTLAIFANAGTAAVTIDNAGNHTNTGWLQTAAPTTGTADKWKLGTIVTGQVGLTVISTQYIQLDINGTLYRLATV